MNEPTILIADDVPIMQQLLANSIRQLGFSRIVSCSNAREVEAAVAAGPIDLAFLDIQMPDKDGLAVLQELLAARPEAYVIMVSGQGTLNTIQRAVALGARGFIMKPYSAAKIRDAVGRFRAEQPA
jgi:two-component system chemotaxis response regulator CheY